MDRRIQAAVVKAVADVEARYAEKSRVQLAEFQRETEAAQNKLIVAASFYDRAQRRSQVSNTARMSRPGDEAGEIK